MYILKQFKALLILPVFLIFISNVSFSQTLNLNQFGIEEGLPQSGIQTLVQDNDGNIWIGTLAGVSRYNGLRFTNFDKKDGLSENRVVSSFMDNRGNIWFGHWAGGLTVYDSKNQKFSEIVPEGIPDLLKSVNCFYQDDQGTIWIGTNGQGLIRYDPSKAILNGTSDVTVDGKFSVLTLKEGLKSNVINAVHLDFNNNILIATSEGISLLDEKRKIINVAISSWQSKFDSKSITAVYKDKENTIWFGTNNEGLLKLGNDYSLKKYGEKEGLPSSNIKVIYSDIHENLFIGTFGGGVAKYLPALEKNNYEGLLFQTIGVQQGLSNDKVQCIIQDREKNIWIGTYLNLNQYFDEQFEIYGKNEGLNNSLIWSVIQDKTGDYWLGTEGGLMKFSQGKNKNENFFTNYSKESGQQISNTTALFEDQEGYIWYSNFGNGAVRLNPKTKQTEVFNDKNGLPNNDIFCISGDKKGHVWLGTNKGGAAKYNLQTKKFEYYNSKNGLGGDQVYSIFSDSKDRLWFGLLGGALTSYDGTTFTQYDHSSGYNNKFTLCITEDFNGNLWFGSYENGIFKFDNKKFTNYSLKEGATSENAFLLVCDKNNNLWVGTRLGIDKFNISTEKFKHYGRQDGFLGIEINPNAVCRDKAGNLLFGSIIGLVKYYAENERYNAIEPITYLDNPRIFYKTIDLPENKAFSYFDNHFTFDFVGASLTNPKRVKYKYILQGYDKDWSPEKRDNSVTYSNLPPGKYIFKVISCNNDEVWNEVPQEFSFSILPPFWKTPWFYSIILIGLVLLTVFYVKYREKKLKEEKRTLEEKVTERTIELQKEKELVEKKNTEISVQKEELQKKNENITDSIDYAKRIQEAVFVPLKEFKEIFPESFIYFKPKDIVSGDFYWLSKVGNKVMFAASDCTGHGVPGAFMSIIGYNLLNSIVKDKKLLSPSLILEELNRQISITLNQGEESRVKDGMDIALCCYDLETSMLEYAGANNSLYHIVEKELIEYKADKLSIGKSALHTEITFTNHSIKIKKNDHIYIFSDGFADQIGGPNKKKFYYPPFRQILLDNLNIPMHDHVQLLDNANQEWKGSRDQIDDILVMGIKF